MLTSLHWFGVEGLAAHPLLRALFALILGFLVVWGLGPRVIRWLSNLRAAQTIRSEGPQSHLIKTGTPTMGGVLILAGIVIPIVFLADLSSGFILAAILVLLGFGVIGWLDDYRKIIKKSSNGLSAKEKYFWQSLLGVVVSAWLAFFLSENKFPGPISFLVGNGWGVYLTVPFWGGKVYLLNGWQSIVLGYFVLVGASNAVNLTDGADGLAIVPVILVAFGLGVFSYIVGDVLLAERFSLEHVPGAGELALFCSAIIGAGLGFLWFNAHPAQVFMGDVGALALGGGLGLVAIVVRQELSFFLMCGVFVVETLSVVIQVGFFKLTRRLTGVGRRCFHMAPLHHHFEVSGVPETKLVVRFWIVAFFLMLLGLSSLVFHDFIR